MRIALSGIAGSGKDYFADFLVKKYKFTKMAFADGTRKVTHQLFPQIQEHYEPFEKEQKLTHLGIDKTPREIWIELSETIRKVDNDYFVKMLDDRIKMTHVENILVTDLRDINEFYYLKDNGFTIIEIIPEKIIYEPNEYDKRILKFNHMITNKFHNDFNGTQKFENYLMNEVLKGTRV